MLHRSLVKEKAMSAMSMNAQARPYISPMDKRGSVCFFFFRGQGAPALAVNKVSLLGG